MDCEEALERIELAAVEPDGLERLMAGDTPDAAAVAGHLVACPACVASLAQVRRSSALIRDALSSVVDEGLRARTLDYVRALGRERRASAGSAAVPAGAAPVTDAPGTIPGIASRAHPADALRPASSVPGGRRRGAVAWVAGVAASAVVAAGLTAAVVLPGRDAEIASQAEELALLARVSAWTVRVESRADATRVALVGEGDDAGTLTYSPSSGELVVVATGLESPPPDREYGCWVESKGTQTWIGRMRFGGEVAGWAGPVEGLGDIGPDAVFRVSLEGAGGGASTEPRLWGKPSE